VPLTATTVIVPDTFLATMAAMQDAPSTSPVRN